MYRGTVIMVAVATAQYVDHLTSLAEPLCIMTHPQGR